MSSGDGHPDAMGETESHRHGLCRSSVCSLCLADKAGRAAAERIASLEAALTKISDIRDSIIGAQTFNWSEHAYPLVAALDAVGFKGKGYETSRANVGTLLERNVVLEAENTRLKEQLAANGMSVAPDLDWLRTLKQRDEALCSFVDMRLKYDSARSALQQAVEALEKGLDWAMCDHAQLCRHRGGVNACNTGEPGLWQCGLKSRVEKMRAAIAAARKVLGG